MKTIIVLLTLAVCVFAQTVDRAADKRPTLWIEYLLKNQSQR
ncbi:MAG TPA: hypothetical protein VFS76_16530 [Pyrinomonadaceae bacterium]|nr:hypothetical protein [Pyrinomonadaceae bacterium]